MRSVRLCRSPAEGETAAVRSSAGATSKTRRSRSSLPTVQPHPFPLRPPYEIMPTLLQAEDAGARLVDLTGQCMHTALVPGGLQPFRQCSNNPCGLADASCRSTGCEHSRGLRVAQHQARRAWAHSSARAPIALACDHHQAGPAAPRTWRTSEGQVLADYGMQARVPRTETSCPRGWPARARSRAPATRPARPARAGAARAATPGARPARAPAPAATRRPRGRR